MSNLVHCDIGITPNMAIVMDVDPTIDYLCGSKEIGEAIGDSLECVEIYGTLPAAVNCPRCEKVCQYIKNGMSLSKARKMVKEMV